MTECVGKKNPVYIVNCSMANARCRLLFVNYICGTHSIYIFRNVQCSSAVLRKIDNIASLIQMISIHMTAIKSVKEIVKSSIFMHMRIFNVISC